VRRSFGLGNAYQIHFFPIWRSPSRAVTPRTKMIIVNTPHNPVGKVFTKEELEQIAVIAKEFNLLVMADEVVWDNPLDVFFCGRSPNHTLQYDCLVFDGKEHVRIANLPGMWDRTVTVGSAGSELPSRVVPDLTHSNLFISHRSFRCHRMASGLADRPAVDHRTHVGSVHPHRLLQ
jgi:hypothetical protein